MDKNQFSFKKLQQFAFAFSCCLYWFPELSGTLSILLQSRFIWRGTVMMGAVPEKSPFHLLLAVLRDKPRPFIPSVVVWILWRSLQPSALSLQWKLQCLSLQALLLQLLFRWSRKRKRKFTLRKKQKCDTFFWRHFWRYFPDGPLTINYLEIVNRSVASCPNSALSLPCLITYILFI